MVTRDEVEHIFGKDVYDTDGAKIGAAAQVYVDDETDEPEWVTVRTGLLGTRESFVPLKQASIGERGLTVPFTKDYVKNAPNHDADGHLTPEEERDLYAYYGSDGSTDERHPQDENQSRDDDAGPRPSPVDEGREGDSLRADTSDDERLATEHQGTDDRLATGGGGRDADRLRLRKVVVTENVTVTVPVQREKVIVEQQGADDGDPREEQVTVDDAEDDRREGQPRV